MIPGTNRLQKNLAPNLTANRIRPLTARVLPNYLEKNFKVATADRFYLSGKQSILIFLICRFNIMKIL